MSFGKPPDPKPVQAVKPVNANGADASKSRLLSAAGYRQSILSDLVSQYGRGPTLG